MLPPRIRIAVVVSVAAALAAAGITYAVLRPEGHAARIRAVAVAPGDPADKAAGAEATRPPVPGESGPPVAVAPEPYQPPKSRSSRTPNPRLTTARPHPVDDSLDGCDNAYGAVGQCVPWTFPPGTEDGCEWLAGHGFGPLPVHGRDRHGLDRDGDGIACGAGD